MKGRRKHVTQVCLGACLSLLLSCGPVLAEDNATEQSGAFELGEVEVIEQADGSPNVSVQRVDERTMRTFNANTVDQAANMVPGVTLSKSGKRNERMIYVRGMDQKHVPIYMDGIPIYVPYDGYPDLSRFTTFDLANITVSKGFSSVLYGPNTMGGAINLVSKRPTKKFEATTGIQAGSYNWNGYVNMGTNQDWWYLQASGSHSNIDTYPLSGSYDATTQENGATRENAYAQDSRVSVKLGLTPNTTDEYAVTYINQHGKKGSAPYAGTIEKTSYWQWPYWDKESIYFNSETWFLQDFYVKTRLYYDSFQNSLYSYDDDTYSSMTKKYAFKSAYDDHTWGGSLELGTYVLEGHELKLAGHYKRDYHSEWAPATPDVEMTEEIYSVGLEDTYHFNEQLYFIAGIGYDYSRTIQADDLVGGVVSDFPTGSAHAINPQLGLFYKVGDSGLAHASVAMKSRIPSLKDKFSYKLGKALPNPELDPERSVNYEIGYRHDFAGRVTVEGNIFYNDISDYILSVTIPDPSDPTSTLLQNQNIGDVDIYGVELGVTAKIFDPLTAGVNYTWLEYDNKTNDDELTETPSHKVFGYVQYQPVDVLTFMADVEYNSDRYSSSDGLRVADGYTLVGIKATWEFLNKKYLEAGLNNLFDTDYEIDEGFPEAGRTWYAGLRMEF